MGKPVDSGRMRRSPIEATGPAVRRRWARHGALVVGIAAVLAVVWAVVAANTGVDETSGLEAVSADDPVLGDASAPVTIVEYGDFKCPSCARFFVGTEPQLRRDYIDTGQVQLVWRDFANIDTESPTAAAAAWCAGQQNRFWHYHDALYTFIVETFYGQGLNAEGQTAYEGHYVELARKAGVADEEAFRACLESDQATQAVAEDRDRADEQGVMGTPTFFVNGQKVAGAMPFEVFAQLIERELGSS